MNRRDFTLSIAALLPALALPATLWGQETVDMLRISNYLNGLRSAQGRFTQVNADRSISSGEYWIQKPGLLRFEYDAPHPGLVMADGIWLGIIDRDSNDDAQRYPINSTPLAILLRDRVNLADEDFVQSVDRQGDQIIITAQDPDRPEVGTISMIFSNQPLAMVEWIVTDEAGQRTRVVLDTMQRDVEIARRMFAIEWAILQRDGGRRQD